MTLNTPLSEMKFTKKTKTKKLVAKKVLIIIYHIFIKFSRIMGAILVSYNNFFI